MHTQQLIQPHAPVQEYRMYCYRWIIVALFGLLTVTNAMMWIGFAPISSQIQKYYHISQNQVNGLAISFQVLYLPATVLVSYTLNKYGIRKGMIFGAFLQCVGAWIRWLTIYLVQNKDSNSNDSAIQASYYLLLLGQALGGIAQPYFTNSPARVAAEWFATSQRDLAVTLCSMLNPVGIAVGQVVPTVVVSEDNAGEKAKGVPTLLLIHSLTASFCLLLTFLFFRDRPPTPPSLSQTQKDAKPIDQDTSVKADLKLLFRNVNFVLLIGVFGLGLGFFNAFTTLIEPIVKPTGYVHDEPGLFGALIIGAGLVGCAIVGPLLDKFHFYNPAFKIAYGLTPVCWVIFSFLLRPNFTTGVSIGFALLGSVMMPILPITFECAVECSYPIPEESSCGVLMCAGNIAGIILTVVMNEMIDHSPSTYKNPFTPLAISVFVFLLVGGVVAFFYNGGYNRLHAEHHEEDDDDLVVHWDPK